MPNPPRPGQPQQQPETPISPAVLQLLQAISREVTRLGIKDAIVGVVDPQTGGTRVIHTNDIGKHAEATKEGKQRYELRKKIAEKLDLQDPSMVVMGGFGAHF